MQITSVRMKNIKSHRDLRLDFSAGINVLSGPNGIGKSTVFEAIGYALFGVDAQTFVGNSERFISIGAKRGEVAVEFSVDDRDYRVSRSVGPPAKWLLAKMVGGVFEVEEHKDGRETEARLKELLGLEGSRSLAEQFELVIGPFQHDFLGPFVIRQQSRRRDRFDEILGIDSWRKTFAETGALLKAIQGRIAVIESTLGPLRDQVVLLPETRERFSAVAKERGQVAGALERQRLQLDRLAATLQDCDRLEQRVKDLNVEIARLKERISNGGDKIGGQKALIAEAEKSQALLETNLPGKQAYEQAETVLAGLRDDQNRQRLLEQEVAALDKRLNGLVERHRSEREALEREAAEMAAEQTALERRRAELAVAEELRQKVAELPGIGAELKQARILSGQLDGRHAGLEEGREKLSEGICPFFGEPCLNIADTPPAELFGDRCRDLTAEKERVLVEIRRLEEREKAALEAHEQVLRVETRVKGVETELERLQQKRQATAARGETLERARRDQVELGDRLAAQKKDLAAYAQLQTDIARAEHQLKSHRAARDLYLANSAQAARLPAYRADLAKFEQLLAALRDELADREKELSQAGRSYDSGEHQRLRQQKELTAREVGVLGQKLESLDADRARLAAEVERLERMEAEIVEKQKQVRTYGDKENMVKFLRNRVFRNVSSALSERFREEISQRANNIYRIIAEVDEELVWGENYQIVLRDMLDGQLRERADDQLSGGQTMSAVVALRLAMLQTIGARIAFFDEPTSHLDAGRRENLAHAFRAIDVGKEEVTEHWYDQLFLISHDVAFTEITDQIVNLDGPGAV